MGRQVVTWNDPNTGIPTPTPPSQPYVPGRLFVQRPGLDQQQVGIATPIDTDYSTGQSAPLNDVLVGTNCSIKPWETGQHMNLRPGNWLAICRNVDSGAAWPAMNIRDFNGTMNMVYNQVLEIANSPRERDLSLKAAINDWLQRGEIALTGNAEVMHKIRTMDSWGKLRALTVTSVMEDWNFKGNFQNNRKQDQDTGRETRVALQGPTTFQPCDTLWTGLTEGSHFGLWIKPRKEVINGKTYYREIQAIPWHSNSPFPRETDDYYYLDNGGVIRDAGYVYFGTVYQRPKYEVSKQFIDISLGKTGSDKDALAMTPTQFTAVLDAPGWLRRFIYTN